MKIKQFKELLTLYKPYKVKVVLVVITSILSSILSMGWSLSVRQLTNSILINGNQNELISMLCIFIGLIIGLSIIHYIQTVTMSVVIDKIITKIQTSLFERYTQLSYSYYDKNKIGTCLSIIDGDTSTIDKLLYHLPTMFPSLIMSTVLILSIFGKLNMTLLIMLTPVILGVIFTDLFIAPRMKKTHRKSREIMSEIMSFVTDKLSGIRTIIGFSNQQREINTFVTKKKHYDSNQKKKWFLMFLNSNTSHRMYNLADTIVLIGGGFMVLKGTLTIVDLLFFWANVNLLLNPFDRLSGMMGDLQRGFSSLDRIISVLNETPEITNSEDSLTVDSFEGNIEFQNVSFKYDSTDNNILSGINLKIKSGEFVAIVGPSGSGKSTIAGLIPRYYDIDEGSIKIDGINIKDINLNCLRKQVGVIQQETYLFSGTVLENIAYGKPDATMQEIIHAAKIANAHEFISNLPNGYHTDIGEKGVKLSGGQKQRISIARMILTNPSIMIFDEATSALDNESEKEVQKAIENLSDGNKTIIVIAHRLSTIKNSDRIIFLDKGGIEEQGSHDKLIQLNGHYAKLYKTAM